MSEHSIVPGGHLSPRLIHNTGSALLDEIATDRDRRRELWRCGAFRKPQEAASERANQKLQPPQEPAEPAPLIGSPLNPRLTFSNFLVGMSNQLACAEAQRIARAEWSDPLHYNPLFLHASVGLGKTHLLQAIALACVETERRVIYLTAERFMYGLARALRVSAGAAKIDAVRTQLEAVDILVIDDVQFFHHPIIQELFCRVLDTFLNSGRQIVIAADRPPGDLENIEERIRSRLAGGLCIEIAPPDTDLRIKILEARIACAKRVHQTFEVPAAVVAYIASVIRTNGRDLDGAVNRLIAHASMTNDGHHHTAPGAITIETAELAIRDLVRTPDPKKIKIEDIQKLVASHFNVSRVDILSARRTANLVRPRQIAMYLSKLLTLRSLPEIGRRFGDRDHTTVLHSVRKITALVEVNKALAEEIAELKRMLLL